MAKMTLTEARKALQLYRDAAAGETLKEAIDTVLGTAEEPTFILTTRDRFAAGAVRSWIYSVRVLGEEAADKVAQAKDVLDRMMDFREKNPDDVKNPK